MMAMRACLKPAAALESRIGGSEGRGYMGYKLGSGPVRTLEAVWDGVELLERRTRIYGRRGIIRKDQTNRDLMELLQNTTKQSES